MSAYGVSGVTGVPNRALTVHSRPATNAAVVGMSSAVGLVSVPTTRPDVASPRELHHRDLLELVADDVQRRAARAPGRRRS